MLEPAIAPWARLAEMRRDINVIFARGVVLAKSASQGTGGRWTGGWEVPRRDIIMGGALRCRDLKMGSALRKNRSRGACGTKVRRRGGEASTEEGEASTEEVEASERGTFSERGTTPVSRPLMVVLLANALAGKASTLEFAEASGER